MSHNVHWYIILPDTDECLAPGGADLCTANATCMNVPGSYFCLCDPGFSGDGLSGCAREYTYPYSYVNQTSMVRNLSFSSSRPLLEIWSIFGNNQEKQGKASSSLERIIPIVLDILSFSESLFTLVTIQAACSFLLNSGGLQYLWW